MSNSPPESVCRFAPRSRSTHQPRRRTRYIYFRRIRANHHQLLLPFRQLPLALQISHRVSPARPGTLHACLRQSYKPRRCSPGAWLSNPKPIARYGVDTSSIEELFSRTQKIINLMQPRN